MKLSYQVDIAALRKEIAAEYEKRSVWEENKLVIS